MDDINEFLLLGGIYAGLTAIGSWLIMLGIGDLHTALSSVPALGFLPVWLILFGLAWLPYLPHSND